MTAINDIVANVLRQQELSEAPMAAEAKDLLKGLTAKEVEAAARLICSERGADPDGPITMGNPAPKGTVHVATAWHAYTVLAAKVLALKAML